MKIWLHLKYTFKIRICIAKITIAPTISACPDPRSQHPANSEKSNVNPKVRRSAVGATRFASPEDPGSCPRARESRTAAPRGETDKEKRETAGSIRNDGNRDRRDGKRTRIAPGEITRARLHLHERERR